MNQIDRNKLIKMVSIIILLIIAVSILTKIHKNNSVTLIEYAKEHDELSSSSENESGEPESDEDADMSASADTTEYPSLSEDSSEPGYANSPLTGAFLNGGADGQAMLSQRITYTPPSGTMLSDDTETISQFYYEPLSDNLRRYITGISYPSADDGTDSPAITYDDLRYVHVLHYNFDAVVTEGELICNASIAEDLLDIFYELYRNEYHLEKVRLIDEYNGDDTASMEDNNTSCFNYRVVDGTDNLSKHALGLALDINPFYNPYVTYTNGNTKVSPEGASQYADRKTDFAYKIDEDDLCYKLFKQHGFTWGGNWNSSKDYQHFQKSK